MNTFLPSTSLTLSARCLDNRRLRNQLNEAKVILAALNGAKPWANHPATLMWKGFESGLTEYMRCIADEMWARAIPVPDWAPEPRRFAYELPPWLGNAKFHALHRANLRRKDMDWYGRFFQDEPDDLYCWPVCTDGTWVLRYKRVGAKTYEQHQESL